MSADNDDDRIVRAWQEASAALAEAENDPSESGRERRIFINDKLADAAYRMAELFKERGQHEESHQAHRQGNKYWSRVVEELGDAAPQLPKQNSTDVLSVREAAHRVAMQRLTKFST